LFDHFKRKDSLFEVVMEDTFQDLLSGMADVRRDLPMRETLLYFARNYVGMALSPHAIGLSRLAITAPNRIPGFGNFAYQTGFSRTVPVLAAYLEKQMLSGNIIRCNPTQAAERFFAAAIGHSRHRILFAMPVDSPARIDAFIVETVDLFIRGLSLPVGARRSRARGKSARAIAHKKSPQP
jgi:AcrR family transcriptional regulator